jgi:protein-S-isoprenylcysteine O-methyltransferase Ste14
MKRSPSFLGVADVCGRAVVCVLFGRLCINLFEQFLRTGHVTGLLLLTSEALVVILTLVQRRARKTDRTLIARVSTLLSVGGPVLLRAADGAALVSDLLTATVTAIGLSFVIAGKVTLGRSFGIVPANRGVIVRGPYNWVRHPIYMGYVISHIGFLAANATVHNAALILMADTALVIRALCEERLLGNDATYQTYCRRVGWHLLPGVY